MIDYVNKDLFFQDSIDKQWTITATKVVDNETVTVATLHNEDLLYDSISLNEALSSSDGLVFGRCESSRLEFTVYNIVSPLKGCELTVDIVLDHDTEHPFRLGTYIVDSDKPVAERLHRKVTAYDRLSKLNEKDVKDWYKALTFPMTIKNFRDSLFNYIGITQEVVELPQDNISIVKTLNEDEDMSALSIVQAICELNGAFGHIGRDDVFHYKYLPLIIKALYPGTDVFPAEDLYPADWIIDVPFSRNSWMNAEYEDYECKTIDGVVIMGEDNEIAAWTKQDAENPFKIEGNFLTFDLDKTTLTTIANNVLPKIHDRIYQPSKLESLGNPCMEVGDSFYFNDRYFIVASYCLSRTLSGTQLLKDSIESTGDEDRSKDLSSISKQLQRLKNKSEFDIDVNSARIHYLEVDHVTVAQLNAANAQISNLWASEAVISGSLSAAIGRIGTIEADYITTVTFQAQSINANKITAGTLSVNRLNADSVTNLVLENCTGKSMTIYGLNVRQSFELGSVMVYWTTKSFTDGDGNTVTLQYLGR
ncbi:MAG: hypothetical protein J6Y02_22215 [Pseudobutyrivibrio sp.]|nr:hypothetical protein [Pseudobutyrivibrio sp.]